MVTLLITNVFGIIAGKMGQLALVPAARATARRVTMASGWEFIKTTPPARELFIKNLKVKCVDRLNMRKMHGLL